MEFRLWLFETDLSSCFVDESVVWWVITKQSEIFTGIVTLRCKYHVSPWSDTSTAQFFKLCLLTSTHWGIITSTSALNHEFSLLNLPFWIQWPRYIRGSAYEETNVTDPLLFETDPDPYTGLWIRIRINPVLSVSGFQDANKINKCSRLSFCLLLNLGEFITVIKDNKSLRSHDTVEIKVFLNFFAFLMPMEGSGSGRPKILRIRNDDTLFLTYILCRYTSGSCWTTWRRTTGRRWSPPTSPTSAPSAPPPLASTSSSRITSTLLTRGSPRRPTRPNRPVFFSFFKTLFCLRLSYVNVIIYLFCSF